MIAALKLGYIDGKCFSTSAITEFLGIDSNGVVNITKNILLAYKEKLEEMIDYAIKMVEDESTTIEGVPNKSFHK